MGTYRKEWDCCGSVTETDGYEPEQCPFCTADAAPFRKDAERYLKIRNASMDDRNRLEHYAGQALDVALDASPAVAQS